MKGSYLRPIAVRWQIGSALLLFAVAGQAMATGNIAGTVKPAANGDLTGATVVATSDKFEIFRAAVGTDGTFSQDVDPGTYTLAVVALDQNAPLVKNVVVKDGDKLTQNFTLATDAPFPIVKAANPIPLTDGIDSASFMDAPEIDINQGWQLPVVATLTYNDWGGNVVTGRFKVKYSAQAIHIAGDVNYKTPRVNTFEGTDPTMLWNGNAIEFDFTNEAYDGTRTATDSDHDWQLVTSLGAMPDWYLHDSIAAPPAIGGTAEPLSKHFMIQDKPAATAGGTSPGETFRLDVPWAILLDSSGKGISPPADNSMGQMDIAVDAADPTASKDTAVRAFQVDWSGFGTSHWTPSQRVPVQFVAQAPAATTPAATPAPTAGP